MLEWSAQEAALCKITAIVRASDDALYDPVQLRSLTYQKLNYDLDLKEESQIVAGDGVGQNPLGMLPVPASFVAPAGLPN
ncbi:MULTISPECIES: phage major capsid protein [Sulfitobacter]|uniref:phage major capsid family protein n=1 Tax=Sulfitobacter TaxID=60136 RepID=UPI00257C373D|nr:phage major capsid protein [Sulfitobacter sp. UBA1132]